MFDAKSYRRKDINIGLLLRGLVLPERLIQPMSDAEYQDTGRQDFDEIPETR